MGTRDRERLRLLRQALHRIAHSARENVCDNPTCIRYGEAPLSRSLRRIADDALRKDDELATMPRGGAS